MAKRRKLENLDIDEVSIVDKGANRRKFMFIKRDADGEEHILLKAETTIVIKSDGTSKGTTMSINGMAVDRLHELGFGFYDAEPDNEDSSTPVMLRYVTSNKNANPAGFKGTKTFVLAKADEDERIDDVEAQVNKANPLKAEFTTDGTRAGTRLVINGEEHTDLWEAHVSFSPRWDAKKSEQSKTKVETNVGWTKVAEADGIRRFISLSIRKAKWTAAQINDLPDGSFLYVEAGGEKDEEGKTKPRTLRHFPVKDANGKVDLPHLRNAIARIPQADIDEGKKKSLQDKARKMLATTKKFDARDLATITEFLGEGAEIGDLTDEQAATLAKCADVLLDYNKIAPADAREAIQELALMAAAAPPAKPTTESEEDEPVEVKKEETPKAEAKPETKANEGVDIDALAAKLLPELTQKVTDALIAAMPKPEPKPAEPEPKPAAEEPKVETKDGDEVVDVDLEALAEQVANGIAGDGGGT